MGHTFPRIESQLNKGLDRFLFEVDARVDLDAAIVCPLFHPCKKVTTIRIDVFAFGGIEELSNVGLVMAIVYPGEAHEGRDVILCVFVISIVPPPLIGMGPFVVDP